MGDEGSGKTAHVVGVGVLAETAVDVTLELLQNTDPAPRAAPRRAPFRGTPGLLILLPPSDDPPVPKDITFEGELALAERLDEWRRHDPLGLLLDTTGATDIDRPLALTLPDGQQRTPRSTGCAAPAARAASCSPARPSRRRAPPASRRRASCGRPPRSATAARRAAS